VTRGFGQGEGRFKYSCLAQLSDGDIGCVFDGQSIPSDRGAPPRQTPAVILARFSLNWLESGSAAAPPAKE
jgi:hypothetical protein